MTKLLSTTFIIILLLTWVPKVSAIEEGIKCDPANPQCDNINQRGETLFCKPLPSDRGIGTCEVFPIPEGEHCLPNDNLHDCEKPLFCVPLVNDPTYGTCEVSNNQRGIRSIFGKIQAPDPLKAFLRKDPTGASAISNFLSNFVTLLFSIAAIALIFMILWGAFEWLTSGGDKEKLSSAQKRIINAFIGIILFALAFAIIRVVGTFTGFMFFSGQNFTVLDRDSQGNITKVRCNNGKFAYYSKNFFAECQKP